MQVIIVAVTTAMYKLGNTKKTAKVNGKCLADLNS